jgi:import inner membrane translocase subunit TIM54
MIVDFFNQRAKVQAGAEAAYRLVKGYTRPISVSTTDAADADVVAASPYAHDIQSETKETTQVLNDLDFDTTSESYYPTSTRDFVANIEKARSDYYAALPDKLASTRALARGEREPTKDETNYPPPTEVELRAERLKKEMRWRGDLDGWNILSPENGVAWDERFREALKVFVDPPEDERSHVEEGDKSES